MQKATKEELINAAKRADKKTITKKETIAQEEAIAQELTVAQEDIIVQEERITEFDRLELTDTEPNHEVTQPPISPSTQSKKGMEEMIKVEYQSSNFKSHGYDPAGADMIVCWIHDWLDCPLEVLELRSVIDKLGN
jgi:hypothetical protein